MFVCATNEHQLQWPTRSHKERIWKTRVAQIGVPLAQRHEGVLGGGGIAPHILVLGNRWR